MSGFVGFTGANSPEEKKSILKPMTARLIHRGPHAEGQYADEAIGLGCRCFSQDGSTVAPQPLASKDNAIVAVFDGEISNNEPLRADLSALGHTFLSCCDDAEVLLHGYEAWGTGVIEKMEGLFSFAIWDKNNQQLILGKDIYGVRPLYYSFLPQGGLLFGSEIKSFLDHPAFVKEVNPDALRPYLSFQYAAGESTFFKGVYFLPEGHYAVWNGEELDSVRYYDFNFEPDNSLEFEACAERIDSAVKERVAAYKKRYPKAGSFLSGGVDSSYIAACLMPETTFSVGFAQDNFNETNYAAELSARLGIENSARQITAEECFEAFPDIQYHMDQPQSNPSSVPLWFLAKHTKQFADVVLSGEGADELFGGYELYANTPAMVRFKKLPRVLRRMLGGIAKAMPAFKGRNFLLKSAEKPENWFIGQANVFPEKEALDVLKPAYRGGQSPLAMAAPYYAAVSGKSEINKKQYLDLHLWMPGDILVKADRMCMAHSLEVRAPLLDRELLALSMKIPDKHYVQGVESKKVFRHAANRTLPDAWANRPKRGFPVPIRYWLREEKYYRLVRDYFSSDFAATFFDQAAILKLLDNHYNGTASNARKVWTVFTYLVWYKRFFIDET